MVIPSLRLFCSVVIVLLLSHGRLPAQTAPATPKGLGLRTGDRVIFIGDSITHQCQYTQYVENFYFTRHPGQRIAFRNAGVSGDKAADVLARFDDDIAAFKPTVATLLIGMNDGVYQDFNPELMTAYTRDMTRLIEKLEALKVRLFLMSPTMFDHQAFERMVAKDPARAKNKNPVNYNAVLAYMGCWLQEQARLRGHQFIDLHGPLNRLTVQQRRSQPDFTLIADAIHPGGDGSFVMAYEMISAFDEPGLVWSVGASVRNQNWVLHTGPANFLSKVEGKPGQLLSFRLRPACLPWAVLEESRLGAALTFAGHRKGSEVLTITGLEPGRYEVLENGQQLGVWDHIVLGRKIELQSNAESPTLAQAQQVIMLNKQRNDEAIRPLRNLYGQRKGRLLGDRKAFESWWNGEGRTKEAELLRKAAEIEEAIYKTNQPLEVEFKIRPAPKAAAKKPAAKVGPGTAVEN